MDQIAPTHETRIEWLDAAKGVGILLVVIGHVVDEHQPIANVIYHFHMPMFFILSGIVFRPEPVWQQLVKRTRSLMVPYLAFLAILTLMRIGAEYFGGTPLRAIGHDEIGLGEQNLLGGRYSTGDYGTFWFVSCLFLSLVAYNAIRCRLTSPTGWRMAVVMAALASISYPLSRLSLPWDASLVPMAMVFIWVGECWARLFRSSETRIDNAATLAAASGLAVLGWWSAPFDMKLGQLGTPILSVIVAIALSHLFFVGCTRLLRVPVLSSAAINLGQATLVILFLHRFFALHLHHRLPDVEVVIVATMIPYLAWVLMRHMPQPFRQVLLGERGR